MSVRILQGDCRGVLGTQGNDSFDSCVTDPPYELGFMGKHWDSTGIANSVGMWTEVFRVLKPGAHLLAFGGTRTYHRMVCAIEDAGFEIRDQIGWVYGSGFPKSLDVSKAIDKAGGVSPAVQAGVLRMARGRGALTREAVAEAVGCTVASVRDWEEGRARSVGAAVEHITPSAEYRDRLANLLGYTADERLIVGATADRRGDGTVVGLGHSGVVYGQAATEGGRQWQGWGTALKPAWEPIVVARKPLIGTVAANVLAHGTGALNIDGCRVGETVETWPATRSCAPGQMQPGHIGDTQSTGIAPAGRWPANIIHDGSDEVLAAFPQAAGQLRPVGPSNGAKPSVNTYGDFGPSEQFNPRLDSGSAARFFYAAKASSHDRNDGLHGMPEQKVHGPSGDGRVWDIPGSKSQARANHHPTVKPTELMRYLCRLVTPPGGIVLDPFMGSGSTLKAAELEGFSAIGIELDPVYIEIARRRIASDMPLFADPVG